MAAKGERELTIVVDANGTLFALDPVEALLGAVATEAFFERALHTAATLTMTGGWAPFTAIARAAYETTNAKLGLDAQGSDVLDALGELPPRPMRAGRSSWPAAPRS
jgi:hypothetical protein